MSSVSSPSAGIPEWRVQVYLYDLSGGMAKALSSGFLGKQIDGIWHSAIVVYGVEYFYGGGICYSAPGQTMAGRPVATYDMGFTKQTQAQFHAHLRAISHRFTPASYSLLRWNCNNFTDEACLFLTGQPIPSHITGLPAEVLATPMGAMLEPMIRQMEQSMKSSTSGGAGNPMGIAIPGWSGDSFNNNSSDPGASLMLPPANPALAPDRIAPAQPAAAAAPAQPAAASSSSSSPYPRLSSLSSPLLSTDRKLTSFLALLKVNNKKAAESEQFSAQELSEMERFAQAGDQFKGNLESLSESIHRAALEWPVTLLFPVLGFLRVLLLQSSAALAFSAIRHSLLPRFLSIVSDSASPPATSALSLCVVANSFSSSEVARSMARDPLCLELVRAGMAKSNDSIRSMAGALALNTALSTELKEGEGQISDDALLEFCSAMAEFLSLELDADSAERLLSAIGYLAISSDSAAVFLQSLMIQDGVNRLKTKFASHSAIPSLAQEIIQRIDTM